MKTILLAHGSAEQQRPIDRKENVALEAAGSVESLPLPLPPPTPSPTSLVPETAHWASLTLRPAGR